MGRITVAAFGVNLCFASIDAYFHNIFISPIDLSNFNFNKTDEELFSQYYEMLNIKQIQFMEDSLKIKYATRVKDYKDYINKFFYIRSPDKNALLNTDTLTLQNTTGIAKSTSVQTRYAAEPVPDSSFYTFLQDENQIRTIEAAKNLTRNSRNYINRSDLSK